MFSMISSLLEQELWNNTVAKWGIAAAIVVLVPLVLLGVRRLVSGRLRRVAERTPTRVDDVVVELIEGTRGWFLVALAVVVATLVIELPGGGQTYVRMAAVALALVQVGLWGSLAVRTFVALQFEAEAEADVGKSTASTVVRVLGLVAVWSLVLLMVLANLGVDITALVAGLGIGGVALALALQNVLGDIFASVSILLDQPFVVGDFIIVGDYLGKIEQIGVKTTRVRSLGGEEIVFSNTDLLQSRVRNYKRMKERRIASRIGVVYQTPADKLEMIPEMLREIVDAVDGVRFDRAHFAAYGDFSLLFELVYFVLSPDYVDYMDVQHAINLGIYRRFEHKGIEFAYPTQTLYTPNLRAETITEALRAAG